MNHLEKIKQQLMIKPDVQERERVAIIIKGDSKSRERTEKKTIGEELEKGVTDLGEQISQIQQFEGILPVSIETKNKENIIRPVIIDKTQNGYDYKSLLNKLAENKKRMVTMKPVIEIAEKKIEATPLPLNKKAKKLEMKKKLDIDSDEEKIEEKIEDKLNINIEDESPEEYIIEKKKIKNVEFKEPEENQLIPIIPPKEKKRKTEKVEKGVAVLGPEVVVEMGDTDITNRLPKRNPPINIKVSSYVMNNREIFVNFINSLFQPYKRELDENKENISCDTIGKTSSDFSLLTHQKIVRDYMNLYTPYRGLLLYHGLGSGKTCTSIAIAEGMKDSKNIIIMTPASLRANYIGELKKCGDLLYKKNQFWEWISVQQHPEALTTMSAILNLPQDWSPVIPKV